MKPAQREEILAYLERLSEFTKKTDNDIHEHHDPSIADLQKPIPFFGHIDTATVLTVGVNPSADEFRGDRATIWRGVTSTADLLNRLTSYFYSAPHPWFGPWRSALNLLGVAYESGTAAHLDLSARATISMQKVDTAAFLGMVENDLPFFFECLSFCRNAKLVMIAGSVTKKHYINEFIQRHAPKYGFQLTGNFVRRQRPGPAKVFTHRLTGPCIDLPVFFCSSSPSDRNNRRLLEQRVRDNAPSLRKHLSE